MFKKMITTVVLATSLNTYSFIDTSGLGQALIGVGVAIAAVSTTTGAVGFGTSAKIFLMNNAKVQTLRNDALAILDGEEEESPMFKKFIKEARKNENLNQYSNLELAYLVVQQTTVE